MPLKVSTIKFKLKFRHICCKYDQFIVYVYVFVSWPENVDDNNEHTYDLFLDESLNAGAYVLAAGSSCEPTVAQSDRGIKYIYQTIHFAIFEIKQRSLTVLVVPK